jgi:hypothetical protein
VSVNRDKPDHWKTDIARSVDMYNDWFIKFAPKAFHETRVQTTRDVKNTLEATDNLTSVRLEILRRNPGVLPTLRMSTCPPLARDRLDWRVKELGRVYGKGAQATSSSGEREA